MTNERLLNKFKKVSETRISAHEAETLINLLCRLYPLVDDKCICHVGKYDGYQSVSHTEKCKYFQMKRSELFEFLEHMEST